MILILEIALFVILALPLPSKYRKPLTVILATPFLSKQVQVVIKCLLAFILLLFIDTISHMHSISRELIDSKNLTVPTNRVEIYSRKFYCQRNMYLTGITLFLTFTVKRTFNLVWELLNLKDKYATCDGDKLTKNNLEKLIEEKDAEIKTLKERCMYLQEEVF